MKDIKKTKSLKVQGFKASGVFSGIKKKGSSKTKDLSLIVSDTVANAAGVFTSNKVKAAPVLIDMERIKKGKSRGVITNSGCANVSVGKYGRLDAMKVITSLDKTFANAKPSSKSTFNDENFLICSTGVIGARLPAKKVTDSLNELVSSLSYDGFKDATEAIMTTDAFPKTSAVKFKIGAKEVTMLGIAKGAGMICPDMATMLCFVMTDASISSGLLKKALKDSVSESFNKITVDGDTSTNDTVLAFANGASGSKAIKAGTADYKRFLSAMTIVTTELAHMIIKDGEGSTKFIEVNVTGASSKSDAEKCARTISTSPLVKTAFFGEDPNWGRLMMAIGRSGAKVRQEKVGIYINNVTVAKNGLDAGNEKKAAREMKKRNLVLTVKLGLSTNRKNSFKMWTNDLGYEYVKINADYRS